MKWFTYLITWNYRDGFVFVRGHITMAMKPMTKMKMDGKAQDVFFQNSFQHLFHLLAEPVVENNSADNKKHNRRLTFEIN